MGLWKTTDSAFGSNLFPSQKKRENKGQTIPRGHGMYLNPNFKDSLARLYKIN